MTWNYKVVLNAEQHGPIIMPLMKAAFSAMNVATGRKTLSRMIARLGVWAMKASTRADGG